MIRKGLQAKEERKRVGRENFPMTTVSVTQLAAYEPALHHAGEEHEEGKPADCTPLTVVDNYVMYDVH